MIKLCLCAVTGGWLEQLLRHLGFVRFDGITEEDGTRWILPDCLLLALSPAIYLACLKTSRMPVNSQPYDVTSQPPPNPFHNIGLRILNAVGES